MQGPINVRFVFNIMLSTKDIENDRPEYVNSTNPTILFLKIV